MAVQSRLAVETGRKVNAGMTLVRHLLRLTYVLYVLGYVTYKNRIVYGDGTFVQSTPIRSLLKRGSSWQSITSLMQGTSQKFGTVVGPQPSPYCSSASAHAVWMIAKEPGGRDQDTVASDSFSQPSFILTAAEHGLCSRLLTFLISCSATIGRVVASIFVRLDLQSVLRQYRAVLTGYEVLDTA